MLPRSIEARWDDHSLVAISNFRPFKLLYRLLLWTYDNYCCVLNLVYEFGILVMAMLILVSKETVIAYDHGY